MSTRRCGDKINFNYGHVKLDFLAALGDWESLKGFHASAQVPLFFSRQDDGAPRPRDPQLVAAELRHGGFAGSLMKSISHFGQMCFFFPGNSWHRSNTDDCRWQPLGVIFLRLVTSREGADLFVIILCPLRHSDWSINCKAVCVKKKSEG